jgi:glycerol-3-phosphate O-acyltransferase
MVPTHRSYVDFLVVSTFWYFYGLEPPLICSGEDFLNMSFVATALRESGAFFMRRTFKGDDLYKAIFTQYVRMLTKENQVLEFFIEGTRSRSNKFLPPKYGFMNVCSKVFFEKDVEEITFVPITINYTKTLESESFIGELRGGSKVKESLSRLLKAWEVFNMDLGTMYVDICDPIQLSKYTADRMSKNHSLDPFGNLKDRQEVVSTLSNDIVFILQKEQRMMSTTMVASIVLLYRKGISLDELKRKVDWLGLMLNMRGANFASDTNLPDKQTLKTGLDMLDSFLSIKQNIIEPKEEDIADNIIMLFYFRNPLINLFFNEGLILLSMNSYGIEQAWRDGIDKTQLFERTCYLSNLLNYEEFIPEYIIARNRQFFDKTLQRMMAFRCIMEMKDEPTKMVLRTSGESQIVFIQSLVFPMVDSYYIVLIYILAFVKNKGVSTSSLLKSVQWLGELLHKQGSIQYFESCNQVSIQNAMNKFIKMGILAKQG